MNITAIMVSSVNGYATRRPEESQQDWTSAEDQRHLQQTKRRYHILVMGSATYQRAKPRINPNDGHLRIVLTRTPKSFHSHAIPGKLEFTDESPETLIDRLSKTGIERILLMGGPGTFHRFLAAGLVSTILLTVEPVLFGAGLPLLPKGQSTSRLSLISVRKLNASGTLLLTYTVLYDPAS